MGAIIQCVVARHRHGDALDGLGVGDEEQVGGLEVAVGDAGGVGGLEDVGDLAADAAARDGVVSPAGEPGGEGFTRLPERSTVEPYPVAHWLEPAYNVSVHPVFADPKTDFVFKRIFGA